MWLGFDSANGRKTFSSSDKKNSMALHKDTQVTLYSGKVKRVSELSEGELLMGADSSPRKIIELQTRHSSSFEVHSVRGKTFVTDATHPLVLNKSINLIKSKGLRGKNRPTKYRHFPDQIRASVANILRKNSKSFYKSFYVTKASIKFNFSPVPIDPYFLGAWLGDGTKHLCSITSMDKEIIDEVYNQAKLSGLKVSINTKKDSKASTYTIVRGNVKGYPRVGKNPLFNLFRQTDLINNKHVPDCYKYNSEQVRLQLLAGFIDTDGSFRSNVYDIFQKNYQLSLDICAIANSLGFRTTMKVRIKSIRKIDFSDNYCSITICGDINRIPVRLPRKMANDVSKRYNRKNGGMKILQTGLIEDFMYLKTDGSNTFLLEDGTVLSGDEDSLVPIDSYWIQANDLIWERKLEELREFIILSNRYPRFRNMQERKLNRWLGYNMKRIMQGKFSKERLQKFDSLKISLTPRGVKRVM